MKPSFSLRYTLFAVTPGLHSATFVPVVTTTIPLPKSAVSTGTSTIYSKRRDADRSQDKHYNDGCNT